MNLAGIDLVKLSKLTSQQMDHITCLECCKHYIAPETAACGHTLCHNCWRGRKSCPLCTLPVERKQLKVNQPIQKLTEHVQLLIETFEKLFNLKLDEFLLDTDEMELENDPTKNVKDWLASSQNQFSAPAQNSDMSSLELKQNVNIEISSKIQVHTATKKTIRPEKIIHVSIPQDDWDKIESMPVAKLKKNKENIIGPMDIEPFDVEDNEYTVNHPRRSSRIKEFKINDVDDFNTNNSLVDKEISKDSSGEMDKKSTNAKQNWNNVKKMRKEFSKLNKKNRNKLNVSIQMCKKTQSTAKPSTTLKQANTQQVLEIDENTPKLTQNDLPDIEMAKVVSSNHSDYDEIINSKETPKDSLQNTKHNANDNLPNQIHMSQSVIDHAQQISSLRNQFTETNLNQPKPVNEKQVKMPFYKKSALCAPGVAQLSQDQGQKEGNAMKTVNHNIQSNSDSNDDIEITIKVGSTITNIVIKKKKDVQVKLNTDREVQTSLSNDTSSQKIDTGSASIIIDSNNEVIIEHKQIAQDIIKQISTEQTTSEIKRLGSSLKSASAKKNTASADTGTGQFQITDSVEKELSYIMECAEIEEQEKTKSVPMMSEKVSRSNTPKPQSNPETVSQKKNTPKPKTQLLKDTKRITPDPVEEEELSYLNDLDIFESDTVKETNVQLLKYAKNTTPSEILICTAHNRNKTQKTNEKRDRGDANEGLPANKKQKLTNSDTKKMNKTADLSKQSKQNQPDSESLNYDCVMGEVFANIDADMEEIKSQNIISQKLGSTNKNASVIKNKSIQGKTQSKSTQNNAGGTQKRDGMNILECTLDDFHIQKNSENLFSAYVEKEDVASASKTNQMQDIEPQPRVDDFLTPVMSRNNQLTGAHVESQVIEVNDDSESVVEDTPQKNTSFGKLKQKSATASTHNSSPRNVTKSRVPSESSVSEQTKTVVNLLDTSEIKSANNVTIIDTRKTTLETPLTINKFVNHIQHNSTPVARKSLNFECENENISDDLEQTLCPTSDAVAKTTQEKELMRKAFEKTPATQLKPLRRKIGKQFCIAGSCLSAGEVVKLKELCSMYQWRFLDKYTRDLTHLVVGVDEENKSQRSVKFMCALAASKWIVSNEWVEKCLEAKKVVGEEMYEALDSTGEPGPRRSRVSNKKLFQGITFFCMEPFSALDADILKEMLEASGGVVVSDVKDVRVTDDSAPAILLADPQDTQEDRFIYLAMKLSIVPVNFEWVLNCLGSYTLSSVQELLLCPSSLLPKATAKWPEILMERDDD